ncbi:MULTISPECIES: bifunctional DNA primase/polymerase [Aerococcus]|uniref:DNA primase n=1 Tax=Aerococcus sanguinicola TaxID=119206 RepID=A0A5N1GPG7_9LACT|nr:MULTISPECIES: bifunctional DNA primase/polymerase [Aerococcus]KAA9301931.1 DNA primase [Aerococcus sanguinicola]MDK6368646.1 bifunctional DNA primase/polymerase [Aerococcus sp. UMB9870]MDK6679729.1 bifunctional DNA primase/polymerase [Aerococcus sp. UMB8608]MDK6685999.1 bifunctional DNA primase/polymerase [Aerococcus sp. UMB8623]MDK6940805.1 bifunctional DNA primase/polymerase [Aerococcus sp. UMB8487]
MSVCQNAINLLSDQIQTIPMNGKKPKVSFKDVPITEAFILRHEAEYEQATGLAVLCRGVWCIDIDVAKRDGEKSGEDSLKEIPYYEELQENAKHTWIQSTPSGGRHIIFKKNEGVNYGHKVDYLEHVDIKAHDNNYFLLTGSRTAKGVYDTVNWCEPIHYEGEFEDRIFRQRGGYIKQTLAKYSASNVLQDYDFSHLQSRGTGEGEGKRAYDRIINGTSENRNNDLFKAVSYAKDCGQPIEPLRCLIGSIKAGDEFTDSEWEATVSSALNR